MQVWLLLPTKALSSHCVTFLSWLSHSFWLPSVIKFSPIAKYRKLNKRGIFIRLKGFQASDPAKESVAKSAFQPASTMGTAKAAKKAVKMYCKYYINPLFPDVPGHDTK